MRGIRGTHMCHVFWMIVFGVVSVRVVLCWVVPAIWFRIIKYFKGKEFVVDKKKYLHI